MTIKVGDIFLAEYANYNKEPKKHYFVCVYTQSQDINNRLSSDVVGIMITTNEKMEHIIEKHNDYNVKVKVYEKNAYVCCDKIYRFSNKDSVVLKGDLLDDYEKKRVLNHYKKFVKETMRQLGGIV